MKFNRIRGIEKILNEHKTRIFVYLGGKSYQDGYDPLRDNAEVVNQNPITVKGYVREITAESLVWRQMGMQEMGAVEVICDKKYTNHFRIANKIEIDGDEYSVYKEGIGNRMTIQNRPFKMIRVVLNKK